MDQRLAMVLEKQVDDKRYAFVIPYNAPIGEAYDICHELLRDLLKMAADSAERAKNQKGEAVEAAIVD